MRPASMCSHGQGADGIEKRRPVKQSTKRQEVLAERTRVGDRRVIIRVLCLLRQALVSVPKRRNVVWHRGCGEGANWVTM